ncbi:MAG: hypothetical protein DFNUSKGM_000814 [Candidatus Fervidibacter sacchari]
MSTVKPKTSLKRAQNFFRRFVNTCRHRRSGKNDAIAKDFDPAAMQLSMFGEVGFKPQPDCKRKRVGRSFKLPTLSHEAHT